METPLPIPNREVKRYSADDTAFGGKVGSRQHKEFNYLNRSEAEGLGIVRGAFYFPLSTFYFILLCMVSWSTRRKSIYLIGTLLVFLFALALPFWYVTYKAPSCTDGLQNQGELGVDCGGACALLCKEQALDPIVRWQRAFKIKEGLYNAAAYVENPNLDSGIDRIAYRFKLYDSSNLLIYERQGETFIPPKKIFGVFESNILTGSRVPARALFEFLGSPVWRTDFASEPVLVFSNKLFSEQDKLPRLTASIQNPTSNPVYNVEVVAILYDTLDNAIASSRTIVDSIPKYGLIPFVFTWPEPLEKPMNRVEFTYRVLR